MIVKMMKIITNKVLINLIYMMEKAKKLKANQKIMIKNNQKVKNNKKQKLKEILKNR
jgi:transcriptional antiterminator